MSIAFHDSSTNLGICQQARSIMRVDATQWPTYKIVNSCNNYLDTIAGYMIGGDKRFQWDDTNHTKLPEGTTASTTASDYSFLTDEQGNAIVTLTGISRLENGYYVPLKEVDRNDPDIDLSTFGATTGTPTQYDKIADNVIRLNYKVGSVISSYFKFYFQRTPSYFTASDTTKAPGCSPLLHRGFVVASAYDGALTLGLKNLQVLSIEKQNEEQKMINYFASRNMDTKRTMSPNIESCR